VGISRILNQRSFICGDCECLQGDVVGVEVDYVESGPMGMGIAAGWDNRGKGARGAE